MPFAHWLRQNSEHYLMLDAQRRIAAKYGRPVPAGPRNLRDRFWLSVFAPTYRRLPWKVRRLTIQTMPGSHRRQWTQPPFRGTPAVGPDGRVKGMSPTSQTNPESGGE